MPPTSSPNRIDETFSALRVAGKKAFVAYLAAGDPDLPQTARLAFALEAAGVDILELGVPFSDPLADGAVNQAAAGRAIASGTTTGGVLRAVRAMRDDGLRLPVVLYTYLNPIYIYGFARFLQEAADAGVDGALILDLPPDEADRNAELRGRPTGLKLIRLIAPNTPRERLQTIADAAEGFIYFVSREGVTGEQATVSASIDERVAAIRAVSALPVVVGFGISNPAQAREAARPADGVVVGSAIVRRVGELGAREELAATVADFVRPLVEAVKLL